MEIKAVVACVLTAHPAVPFVAVQGQHPACGALCWCCARGLGWGGVGCCSYAAGKGCDARPEQNEVLCDTGELLVYTSVRWKVHYVVVSIKVYKCTGVVINQRHLMGGLHLKSSCYLWGMYASVCVCVCVCFCLLVNH